MNLRGRPPFSTIDPKTGLSARALEVLRAIVAESAEGPASQRRVAKRLGIWPRAVEGHLARFREMGLVTWSSTPGPASLVATPKGARWAAR
jgi:Mn-dependent DtxR family transcriptional regulator